MTKKQAKATGDQQTILVVEDNELNLKLFKDLLESRGYHVSFTSDGLEAVELTHQVMPDLILMDIQLQGISGFDIIKQIKADGVIRHIPIIAVTAFAMKDDKERILESGCEAYMAKPISIGPFLEMVGNFVKKK